MYFPPPNGNAISEDCVLLGTTPGRRAQDVLDDDNLEKREKKTVLKPPRILSQLDNLGIW